MAIYIVTGHDNDSFAFSGRAGVRQCPSCRALLDKWHEPLSGLRVRRLRKADISTTYDGVLVVAERLKSVCDLASLTGATFIPLPDDPGYYRFDSSIMVTFDAIKAGTRFEDRCPDCGQYGAVAGLGHIPLKPGSHVPDNGFAKTDVEFGSISSYDERSPIYLCGEKAAQVLKSAHLRGLVLIEANG